MGTVVTDSATNATYQVTNSDQKDGTVAYTGTTEKKNTSVKIPTTVTLDGVTYQVTAIADNAFKNNKTVTKVTVPKSVTTIGKNAFSGCTKLKTVSIGSQVTTIEANAFKGCKALTKITLPEKTTIKVPKGKAKAYKSLFQKKGLSKKVTVK